MKKILKVLTIILILIIIFSGVVYIDYFVSVRNNTIPKISIKKEISEDLIVYNAIFYRVWYCKANDKLTLGNYNDKDAVCSKGYNYKDGYYTNESNIKISKRNMILISSIYDSEQIENMNSEDEIKTASQIALEYGKINYKKVVVNDVELKADKYNVVVFQIFDEDSLEWKYDEKQYCIYDGEKYFLRAEYSNNTCGEFESITMSDDWCNNYKNSSLINSKKAKLMCSK